MVGQVFVQKKAKAYNDLDEKDFAVTFASSKIKINAILLIPVMSDRQLSGF